MISSQGPSKEQDRQGSQTQWILWVFSVLLRKTVRTKKHVRGQQRGAFFRKLGIPIVSFVLIGLVFSALIAFAVSKSMELTINNSARITLLGVDVFGGDVNSLNGVFSVDLGQIYVGGSKNVSFYLQSVSNVPTTLALSVDNWEPEGLEHFMFVSWNYSGTQITPREQIPIRIDLNTVNSADFVDYLITNHVTSFSFNLRIYPLG